MNDPLARFQKAQLLAHEISDKKDLENQQGLHSYHAFGLLEKGEKSNRLQIRRVKGATHSPSYHCLLDLCYDGVHGTGLILIYSFMQIKIKGKHLQPLITAIEKHDCAYIQDFDSSFFAPAKANETLIEVIEVVHKELDVL